MFAHRSASSSPVLRPAHKAKLIEYDQSTKTVTISPLGIEYTELLVAKRKATSPA
jgi:hypothetical protein